MPTLLSSLSLALSYLLIAYIASFCFSTPIPDPTTFRAANGKNFQTKAYLYYLCSAGILLSSIYHAVLSFVFPITSSVLCPNTSNLSSQLFTWNLYTALCVGITLFCGQILLVTFDQLGPQSNLQLTEPKKLITTGLYSWVQHPSYTAQLVILLTNCALVQRLDGAVACWLPHRVVHSDTVRMVLYTGYLLVMVGGWWALSKRVRNEEAMLKKAFGQQWEEYHIRTKRFIPGVI